MTARLLSASVTGCEEPAPPQNSFRQHRATLVNKIEYWTGVRRSVIRALVTRIEEASARLGLAVPSGAEAPTLMEVTTYATTLVMNYLTHGRSSRTAAPPARAPGRGNGHRPPMRIIVAHGADESVDAPKGRRKTDVQEVAAVLRKAEHEVVGLAVDGTSECLRVLAQAQADLVFNLVESFGGDDTKEPQVAGYYDLLGLRYTGSGARGLTLAMDKALAKKVFTFHDVATPRWAVVWRGRLDSAHDIDFPVIVKPAREDGSIALALTPTSGTSRTSWNASTSFTPSSPPVLIEQYIEGREIYMGVLGDDQPEALPPVELDLSHLPKGTPASRAPNEVGGRHARLSRQQGPGAEAPGRRA